MNEMILLAADTIGERLLVSGIAILVGAAFVLAGFQNIKTRTAKETGKRRLVNKALGRSNTYKGSQAVLMGWMRVIAGIGAILFGIVFLFVGPFLAK